MLQVVPKQFISFDPETGKASVYLKCISKFPIAYKVLTTAPQTFRVRSRRGFLVPNECTAVRIYLTAGEQLREDGKDKFLIIAAPSEDCCTIDVNDLWRNVCIGGDGVQHIYFVCRFEDDCKDDNGNGKQACDSNDCKQPSEGD